MRRLGQAIQPESLGQISTRSAPYLAAALAQQADLWVWGHGMVAPTPGLLWSAARPAASQPVRGRVFFAHTDYSRISIFEEGFYQGIRAAREMLGNDRKPLSS